LTKKTLPLADEGSLAEAFDACAYPIASHDAGSLFNYANPAALSLFKTRLEDMVGVHSSASAPDFAQQDRERLLAEVTQYDYSENYQGIRTAFDGTLFQIHNATVWNIIDESGHYHGQAVVILEHTYL
jgi:PAS domain-containing protein|tara:strand:+ start:310 stop:693 length:384 start_codon:yes stop_codon:yes gene_type:complete